MRSKQRLWVLSGGLASGKSQVRGFLSEHGFHTIDADSVGHDVLRSDGPAFDEVAKRWPQVVEEGEVDRSALAEIVFNDPSELISLESITHPHIFGTISTQVEDVDAPVVVEMPLIKHSLGSGWRRIVVDCRDELRLRRAVGRGMAEADVRSRMSAQPSRAEWLAIADVVVPNHGDLGMLSSTVDCLVSKL